MVGRWSQLRRWLWSGPDPNIGFDSQCAATSVHSWVKNWDPKRGSNTVGLEMSWISENLDNRSYLKLLPHPSPSYFVKWFESIILIIIIIIIIIITSHKNILMNAYDTWVWSLWSWFPTCLKRRFGVDRTPGVALGSTPAVEVDAEVKRGRRSLWDGDPATSYTKSTVDDLDWWMFFWRGYNNN